MVSDVRHPGRGGEGGQKRENLCGRPLWMAPYSMTGCSFLTEHRPRHLDEREILDKPDKMVRK